ncbi:MAG: hypothetical protein U0354_19650 [Candidatus Sericytochromatia bacterium]
MLKKSLASLLLPVLVASCATGVNLNTPNTNTDKVQISNKLMSTVKDRIKIYSGAEAQKMFKVTKQQSGFKVKANAFEPDYVIQHTSRTDAQCVKITGLTTALRETGSDQAIAIFNTQGDTYASGAAEAYAVIFNLVDGTIKYVIETSGMEFSDVYVIGDGKEAQIFMVGDDSSQDLDTAFVAKWSYDYINTPDLKINADSDLSNDDLFYLEGRNATSIISTGDDQKTFTFGVTTGENGYFYNLSNNRPGFTIKNKIKDSSDSGDFRTATINTKSGKVFILDGGWDQTSASGSTNAKQDPKIIVLDSITFDRSTATEFNLPFSSSTTGLGANYNFGTEKPGGQLSRTKILSIDEYLVIAAGSGGLVSVRNDGMAGTEHDMTSLINKGPIPLTTLAGGKTNAIINDVFAGGFDGKTVNLAAISGYFGLTTIKLDIASPSSTKTMDYRLFENPSGSTDGTSTNSMNMIRGRDRDGKVINYLAVGNGARGGSIYLPSTTAGQRVANGGGVGSVGGLIGTLGGV